MPRLALPYEPFPRVAPYEEPTAAMGAWLGDGAMAVSPVRSGAVVGAGGLFRLGRLCGPLRLGRLRLGRLDGLLVLRSGVL